ncbi:MAG: hypothetical protein ACKVVP_23995 [Chloroflexota bacterium]
MRIIVNSDILWTNRSLATGLPTHIVKFCHEAVSADAILVLPQTVILELERKERDRVSEEIQKLRNALSLLRARGVEPDVEPEALVVPCDLVSELRQVGIPVEVEKPLLEDYQEAERRACLHLPPHLETNKSDEMRDLVIWMVARRLAMRDGQAILLSRDKIHHDTRSRSEAENCGLWIAKNFDKALDLIGREGAASTLLRQILEPLWTGIRSSGLPLTDEIDLRRTGNVRLVADRDGRASGSFDFTVQAVGGRLSAAMKVAQNDSGKVDVELTRLSVNGSRWGDGCLTCQIDGQLPKLFQSAEVRLHDLRALLEVAK